MTNRADMSRQLALSSVSPVKTYVVEAHADDPAACLSDLPGRVEPTEDAFLFRVATAKGHEQLVKCSGVGRRLPQGPQQLFEHVEVVLDQRWPTIDLHEQ